MTGQVVSMAGRPRKSLLFRQWLSVVSQMEWTCDDSFQVVSRFHQSPDFVIRQACRSLVPSWVTSYRSPLINSLYTATSWILLRKRKTRRKINRLERKITSKSTGTSVPWPWGFRANASIKAQGALPSAALPSVMATVTGRPGTSAATYSFVSSPFCATHRRILPRHPPHADAL